MITKHPSVLLIYTGGTIGMIQNPETQKYITDCFNLMRNNYKDQDVGLLFNAFSEKRFGPIFNNLYRKQIYGVYADSGGLQAITLGREITPEFKMIAEFPKEVGINELEIGKEFIVQDFKGNTNSDQEKKENVQKNNKFTLKLKI